MLAVSDDELTMRDNNDMSSEVAEAGHLQEGSGRSCGWA